MKPLVSIIIPAYNSGRYLSATIRSALGQTWDSKEIIVIDNGSTDNTAQIIKDFENDIVSITMSANNGAAAARNAGLAVAKGNYIQFLDADDLLSADKIESQLTRLNNSATHLSICRTVHFMDGENHTLVKPDYSWFDADSDNPVDFLLKLYAGEEVLPGYGGMITVHSWLTPRSVIDKAGSWNEELSVDDDGEFFCRVILASAGIKFSEQGLCYYRKFTGRRSLSSQKNLRGLQSTIAAIDLKYQYLTAKSNDKLINRIFARHYWWTGVLAYPEFKALSKRCIQKATALGYNGEKYVGGPAGHTIANILGWKAARLIVHYQQVFTGS
ncbi:glycosyltransferase family A protein [Mucilaginibacter sp. UR6-11]|uniref:glycosyltransferase family 2 protein n=1 Tax=Mucilaginibacter sp. UR6-11 TaxID=1435644 RepID=UPI001E5C806D|nr:glycosyltransferase family A protein [Mucilaginibacter sp. UR6-11]MCC8425731.1 glycosyltransferase family 2 protein [Mucilaginibacter sp. UR6-11]